MNKNIIDRILNAFGRIESQDDYIYIARLAGANDIENYIINNESIDEAEIRKTLLAHILDSLNQESRDYFFERVIDKQNERVISALEAEEIKIELLDRIQDDYKRAVIIASLDDDNKKIELLERVQKPYSKKEIIKSLKDDDLKLDKLYSVRNPDYRDEIITSFNDDNIKAILMMNGMVKNYAYVIKSLKDDETKIDFIDCVENLSQAIDVITTLESDDLKIEFLEELRKSENKTEIIKSLKDDNKKIEELKKIPEEFYRAEIIATLENDEKKDELLQEVENEGNRAFIIQHFKDDKLKAEYIKTIEDERLRRRVIETIEDINVINGIPECRPNYLKRIQDSNKNKQEVKAEILKECDVKYKEIGLDRDISYGIEIEAEGIFSNILKKQRVALGEWRFKREATIIGTGMEAVSPVLHDNEEDVSDIYCLNKMLSSSQMEATDKCAGHVHIGADYLKSFDSYVNLFELFGNTERILFQISNSPGSITRKSAETYAKPISKTLEKALENGIIGGGAESANELIDVLKNEVINNRETSMNIMNIDGGKNTIEFRMANGTLDANEWIENIRLYGRLVQRAEELTVLQHKDNRTEEETSRLKAFERLKENIPEEEKAEILFDLLFVEEEKQVYQKRYEINHKMCEEFAALDRSQFGIVDFRREYEGQVSVGKDLNKIERSITQEDKEKTNEERVSE